MNYLAEPAPLKELILSQGTKFLENKIDKYVNFVVDQVVSIRKRWNLSKIIGSILDSGVFGWGIIVVLQRLVNGVISIGQLTFEIRALRIFSDSFGNFMGNLVALRESSIKIGDILDLFTKYEADKDGNKILKQELPLIKFNNVSFKYPNSDKYIFKDLNLEIKPGEKIAIVGENGAGKTTLIKLLCRFYRVNRGTILLSEVNVNDLKIKNWYKKLGVLFQDYNAYGVLTVRENIEIDSTDKIVTEESLIKALKEANAISFVQKYKNKLNQILSERFSGGTRPSTGQWQKIAIARVFHRNAPILILDEPTASIDAVAESKIFDNIYEFSKGKTVIIISHRFSTVRNADRIIVLDKGKIIEQGSHEELLKLDGKYAKAFKLQAKGYQ
jgi:ATP-binding cassette subfamily B protein